MRISDWSSDVCSSDLTGRDAKRVFVDDKLPKDEFERKWSGICEAALDSGMSMDELSTNNWIDQDCYRVSEYWRLIERKRLVALFQNGKIFELSADNLEDLVAKNGPPIKTRVTWCSFAQMHLVTGFAILSGPYEYRLNRLPIVRMRSEEHTSELQSLMRISYAVFCLKK